MTVAAVICEFNPFHNGHKYLIDKIKSEYADCVIAIMSGSFVQRGDVAIVDKYERAKAALQNGCDLVVELPTVYAVSSAEFFSKGGVSIAKALNADMLCFGAENDNISILKDIADAFSNEHFIFAIKEQMENGDYYAKAVSTIVSKHLSKEHADILNGANNTLGIEYIKALKNTGIRPVAIKRTGVSHDSSDTSDDIASATHIRSLIKENKSYEDFTKFNAKYHADIKNLETAILYKLRLLSKEQIENLPDVNEGLHNRIFDACRKSNSLEELYDNLKTKRYTLARLRRIVICALLDITKEYLANDAKYIRVLAMNDSGARVIKNCNKLPIVAKVKSDYNKLTEDAKVQFDVDVRASEVFSLAVKDKPNIQNDFCAQIIKQ
ncbi:MAG: nucleotidyltransferase family protein [Ruminococcus sp.]|nr:nucleotidyltransferase family protein [Ruminococcus sp.]